MQATNQSSKNYHWQMVRPHAAQAVGDQRINPFGVGGEIEIRSGLLVQKQPITGPQLHFGLGEQTGAEVVRVVWPNGTVRAEFEREGGPGSCDRAAPERLVSVPVCLQRQADGVREGRGSLGLGDRFAYQYSRFTRNIAATGEWYKIGRDQLVPHDGFYDIRVTAELWEVYYYDYLALMTVDHPVGTEIFVDERFVIPPAKLGITVGGHAAQHRARDRRQRTGRY